MIRCLLIPMGMIALITLFRHATSVFSFESINRHLFPFFRNHVNYGAMLVCLLAVAFGAYQHTTNNKKYRKGLQIFMLIGIAGLIFSYSRGAWLALIGGLVTVWIIRKRMIIPVIITTLLIVLISTVWLSTDQSCNSDLHLIMIERFFIQISLSICLLPLHSKMFPMQNDFTGG